MLPSIQIFIQAIDEGVHWSKKKAIPNTVRGDLWEAEAVTDATDDSLIALVHEAPAELIGARSAGGSGSRPGRSDSPKMTNNNPSQASGTQPPHPTAARDSHPSQQAAPQAPSRTVTVGGGIGCRLAARFGVICLIGPEVEMVARQLSSQVPELARRMR